MIHRVLAEPEVWGATVGLLGAGAGWGAIQVLKTIGDKMDLKILRNSKNGKNGRCNGTHCTEHDDMVGDLREIKTDVRWLKTQREQDATYILLDGILNTLKKRREDS